jgi:amino acid permease
MEKENMDKHVQLIGILWIVYGVLSLFAGIFVLVLLLSLSTIPDMNYGDLGRFGPHVLRIIAICVSSFLFILGIPKIIGGLGLQKRKEWARILLMIMSFLSLLNIPLGTALGIYSIVYLMKPEMIELFKHPKTA